MEAAALSTSSRVTVELTDPSNLWDTFEPLLKKHLPLHNLHWKSSGRPLRSIDTLHVAITKAEGSKPESGQSQRRHQIPGLKQTPYLKIYLLRCDDNETYKEICRKQIRQWIKSNAQSPDSKTSHGTHERHDAFEYLIVHVVLPDTSAAAQPRISKNSALGTTDSTDSLGNKSKWPGKSSSTLFEKLRADFSSSSKSALERVAQIRLQKLNAHAQAAAPSALPAPDLENQWEDLLEKLKASILTSFHIRVAQYEDDIRERDSQRHLPGWNFCTFFILKEGLALGFESVGLLEDASMIYDELAAGLDVVVREQGNGDSDQEGSLLSFSKELKDKIRSALESLQVRSDDEHGAGAEDETIDNFLESDQHDFPLSTDHKRYRELILANNVSSLDFRIYVFSRQLELLHHMVEVARVSERGSPEGFQQETLLILAEICRRASTFINFAARCMRSDLYNAWGGKEGLSMNDLEVQRIVINNIVSTWSWRVVTKILADTSTDALKVSDLVIPVGRIRKAGLAAAAKNALEQEANGTSRPGGPVSGILEDAVSDDSSQIPSNDETISEKLSDLTSPQSKARTAILSLASSRAELYLLGRGIIETAAPDVSRLVLQTSRYPIEPPINGAGDSQSRSIVSQPTNQQEQENLTFDRKAGLNCLSLRQAAGSTKLFTVMYEKLTYLACCHFLAAEEIKSANRTIFDLAKLKYHSRDLEAAVKFLEHVRLGNDGTWTVLAASTLSIYSDCLKRLERNEELVCCLLDILSLSSKPWHYKDPQIKDNSIQESVDELLSTSRKLAKPVEIALGIIFELPIREMPSCCPDEQHGVSILLPLRLKIPTVMELQTNSCLTLNALAQSYPAKITMHLAQVSQVGPSSVTLRFISHEFTLGWYQLENLELRLENLVFKHNFATQAQPPSERSRNQNGLHRPILIYPASSVPKINAIPSTDTDLSQPRQILIQLKASSQISDIVLSLRPATAGFRFRLSDAESADDSENREINFRTGQGARIGSLEPDAPVTFNVPYSVENPEITELGLKAEVSYTTESGTFVLHTMLSVSTILQVSVNVHDMFKASALFSRFTITPSTLVPLRLKCCRVQGTSYEVAHGADFNEPVDVFPKQPASWLCRFTSTVSGTQRRESKPPKLLIKFECLDEMVLSALEIQLLTDIGASDHSHLSALFCAHLVSTYRSKWTEQDLEGACLLREVELWSFEDLEWTSILVGLEKEQRKSVSSWLREWHQKRSTIKLGGSKAPLRSIEIPIEIPTPRVVVSASLELKPDGEKSGAIALSQPVAAEMVVAQTNRWQSGSSHMQNEGLEITFEVVAPPELWLIGGHRRGTVSRSVQSRRFQLLLLPQRAGHLLLPSIEVKCFSTDSNSRRIEIACETDYPSQAKSVLVIPHLKTKTWTGHAVDGESAVVDSS